MERIPGSGILKPSESAGRQMSPVCISAQPSQTWDGSTHVAQEKGSQPK